MVTCQKITWDGLTKNVTGINLTYLNIFVNVAVKCLKPVCGSLHVSPRVKLEPDHRHAERV